MIEKLKYASTERVFEGIIVDHNDASVTIDIKGRLGQFKMPMRMLISDCRPSNIVNDILISPSYYSSFSLFFTSSCNFFVFNIPFT